VGYGQQPGYPPPGYQPPGGGYQQPGPPPPGYPSRDDKTWALVAHLGGAGATLISGGVLGFVPPLIALLGRGNQSPTVRAHAAAALNFFILVSGAALIIVFVRIFVPDAGLFTGLFNGLLDLLQAAVTVVGVMFGVVGGVRANDGQLYRYPIQYPFVR
jgi:hypothetical protein